MKVFKQKYDEEEEICVFHSEEGEMLLECETLYPEDNYYEPLEVEIDEEIGKLTVSYYTPSIEGIAFVDYYEVYNDEVIREVREALMKNAEKIWRLYREKPFEAYKYVSELVKSVVVH